MPAITQPTYLWNTGDTTQSITVDTVGTYTLTLSLNIPLPAYDAVINAVTNTGGESTLSIYDSTNTAPQPLLLITGNKVYISGADVALGINGIWIVTKIDATHFKLQGSVFTGAGIPSGSIQNLNPITKDIPIIVDTIPNEYDCQAILINCCFADVVYDALALKKKGLKEAAAKQYKKAAWMAMVVKLMEQWSPNVTDCISQTTMNTIISKASSMCGCLGCRSDKQVKDDAVKLSGGRKYPDFNIQATNSNASQSLQNLDNH